MKNFGILAKKGFCSKTFFKGMKSVLDKFLCVVLFVGNKYRERT